MEIIKNSTSIIKHKEKFCITRKWLSSRHGLVSKKYSEIWIKSRRMLKTDTHFSGL